MLRFPATQGTILVQCPVCSHRFTYVPDLDSTEEFQNVSEPIPNFQFKPSFQSYKELILDLLYAPIDYLKSKQGPKKREIKLIPILLITILLLYFWKWSSLPESPNPEIKEELQLPSPMIGPDEEHTPEDSQEEREPNTKPSYEI
ncbi:hypothetical protein [Leptospira bandrabouensis]|uniref:hypothetical protein n=1 Tax=Leptospira bandrabouensis TaxID=2484903 RepID=UPI001EEBDD93|nr:hypothetical protein [Leptospira bandrabouensis]MCG6152499.1 hypothetical protein [Leptospira bandrabouensis]